VTDEVEVTIPSKAQPFLWLNKGWDWFVENPANYMLVGLMAAALLGVTYMVIWGPVMLGLAAVGIRRAERGKVEAAQFFDAFRFFVPSLFAGLIVLVLSLVGALFLIVPGVVILSMYLFTFHFIYERGMDFWDAMEASRRVVAADYLGFALFAFLIILVNLLGIAFLLVGVVVTIPVTSLALTAAFRDCTSGLATLAPSSGPVVID
jgi:uncharacterized membrane protein